MFFARKAVHCRACVDLLMRDPHVPLPASDVRPLVDPTVCAACGRDGEEELGLVGGLRVCGPCTVKFRRPPVPAALVLFWLTLAAALGYAAERAVAWAGVARELDRAASALDAGRMKEARSRLAALPTTERRLLLWIRLEILDDRLQFAHEVDLRRPRRWVPGSLARDVQDQLARADLALVEWASAMHARQEGRIGEALGLIRRARLRYPQSFRIAETYLLIDGLEAFSRRDIDRYVLVHTALGEGFPDHLEAVLHHAAALAAKEDPGARGKLQEARVLAGDDPPSRAWVERWSKFVEDRLATRRLVAFEEFEKK
jgi:hypothetical protein